MIALVLTLLAAAPVRAQPSPVIAAAPECGHALEGLSGALTVELSDREAELASLEGRAITLAFECSPEAVTVRATDDASGRFVGQRVDRTERGLSRQLAIVSAELLVALASRREPAPAPPEPPAPIEPTEPPPRGPGVALRVAARLEGTGTPLVALGGGAVGVEVELDPAVRLALDLGAGWAELGTTRGRIGALPIGLSASLRFGGALGDAWLGLGPSVEAALVLLSGQPSGPGVGGRDGALPLVALGGVAVMRVALAGTPLAILLELEGSGVPLAPIALVDGAPGLELGPARFGGRLGLAITP